VTCTKDFRTTRGKLPQLPIRACALQEERRLGLIKLTSDAPHLLIAQSIGVLHHRKRIACQGSIGKDIDEASNQFNHFPLLLLDYSMSSLGKKQSERPD
jgi:hypothetical protein